MTTAIVTAQQSPSIAAGPAFLRRLLRKPLGLAAVGWVAFVIFVCYAAPLLTHYDPLGQNLLAAKQLPSASHWLGTDTLGRDVLSRLLYGGQPTLIAILEAVAVATVLGVGFGIASGYFGGLFDRIVQQVVSLLMAMPTIIILLAVLAVFQSDMTPAMLTLGVLGSATKIRVIRSATLAVRQDLYIEAARIAGLGSLRIVLTSVLPRVLGPITVQVSLFAATALTFQTGLSFLGLGIQPPSPSWGGMIQEASTVAISFPWLLVPSGVTTALTVLAFGLIGDAARDAASEGWLSRRRPYKPRPAELAVRNAPISVEPEAVLAVRNLTVVLEDRIGWRTVLDDVSFDLKHGETLGLVGESGCGKTMTALSLLGLLPPGARVVSGQILMGERVVSLADSKSVYGLRGSEIGMIFQDSTVALDPSFRVGDQLVEVIRRHSSLGPKAARERAIGLLASVKLVDPEDAARRYPHQLSGGMAQRVAIARSLAANPKILIADEPTTALDVTVQEDILDLLATIQRERGTAIILVTHDWGVVADACDRAIVLYAGEIAETATADDLFERPRHPYTADLLLANPYFAIEGEPLPTIPGTVVTRRESQPGCQFAPRCRYAKNDCVSEPIALRQLPEGHMFRCIHSEEVALKAGQS